MLCAITAVKKQIVSLYCCRCLGEFQVLVMNKSMKKLWRLNRWFWLWIFFIFKKSRQKLGCVLYTGTHYTRVNTVNHVTTTLFAMANAGILGFHQSYDQNKNRNHLMKKVKSLRYDRWLIYKQPCQESGLCCFSLSAFSQKCVSVSPKFIELCMEAPCLCCSEGTNMAAVK